MIILPIWQGPFGFGPFESETVTKTYSHDESAHCGVAAGFENVPADKHNTSLVNSCLPEVVVVKRPKVHG